MKLIPLKENPKIFRDDKWRLYTKNLVKGQSVYGEKLIEYKGEEYREWIANRSKLAAAIKKKIGKIPIEEGDKVLYLGIAAGTTASHISDIIGWKGLIYGIDVAPRILIELMKSIGKRKNIIPILADASKPDLYLSIVPKVDLIYQDIAQPHQVKILINNVDLFLKNKGYVFFAVKARSIDVSKDPRLIFDEVGKELEEYGFKIVNKVRLEPYHKDHMMFLLQK
ncbi:fibrillarin-like rRNA/tRNA 2'-O-methyltransferase [Nanoarchaeota archaeon NZ13-N]|nr:MAG: fibrillarin-like rRNA/tRNA 2'-O-methyltransferase [Nanoarchaeota archaeon NZ13-N]